MSNFFSWFEERKFRKARINILLHELYNHQTEVSYSIKLIGDKRLERDGLVEVMSKLEKELPSGEEKLKPEAQKIYETKQKEIAAFRYMVNSLELQLKKLYEDISQKAHHILAIQKTVEFNRKLRLDNVPQLPYIEINGTRYQAKNNMPVKDENGIMVLYMANEQQIGAQNT